MHAKKQRTMDKESKTKRRRGYKRELTEMSEKLELLKRENHHYANQPQNANKEKQSLTTSLRLVANELRNPNRCQLEHVDTPLLAENKSL